MKRNNKVRVSPMDTGSFDSRGGQEDSVLLRN